MTERVLYVAQRGKAVPWDVPVRELAANEVRVKVRSVGINPIDWKTIDNNLADGAGQGNDFAGEVVEVGADVRSVSVGDTVAGGVGGGDVDNKENGAFTPLLTVAEHLLFQFPSKLTDASSAEIPHGLPTTFQQAASLGIALDTTAIAFESHAPRGDDDWAVVYGSASSLGYVAAQYARNLGYNVIGVSAPHADLYDPSLGINFLDRHDAAWPKKAAMLSQGRISYVFDTIGLGDSAKQCFEAVAADGVLSFADPSVSLDEALVATKPGVVIKKPLYFLLMQPVKKFGATALPGEEGLLERAPQLVDRINKQLRQNEIFTLPITVLQGLDKVTEGLDLNRRGVSARKIVINV